MDKFQIIGVNDRNKEKLVKKYGQYSNVIFIPSIFIPHLQNNKPIQIWRGSRFSAKSWTKALQFLLKASDENEYFRGIFARNTQKNARDSQYQLFQDLLKKYPLLGQQYILEKAPMRITHINTGQYIQGGSFEDSDSLLSVPEITDFWSEEPISRGKSINRTAFEDIRGTLRNSQGVVPKFHFTFNPIGKNNFIYQDFFDKAKRCYSSSEFEDLLVNYVDNPFCPEENIKYLDGMKKRDPVRYLVDGLGKWGEPQNDAPWLSNYDDKIHYNEEVDFKFGNYETWITFDFNHTPCTASVYQLVPRVGILGIRSYKQNGGTRKLCQLMKQDKELMKVNMLLWTVTGDSSGKSYTATGGDVNDYDIIKEEFGISYAQIVNVRKRNASLVYSRRLNNEFLYRVPFQLSKSMTDLRNDLMIAKEDEHGNLYKNRENGYGMDFLDHHRYFVHAICPKGMDDINYLVNKFR